MIEIFKYYSHCNQAINSEIVKIIEKSNPELFNYKVDGYYKSIGEILNHYFVSDMIWLDSFRIIKDYSIYKQPIFDNIPEYGTYLFDTLQEFKENRIKLDSIIVDLTDEISSEDHDKMVIRMTKSGQKMERLFWKTLIHMFNHQSHHRGQISQILDQLQIQNDYSNMIRYE